MMDDREVAIRGRRAKISPAPWKHDGRGSITINTKPFRMGIVRLPAPDITARLDTPEDIARMQIDYDFIAHAPEDIDHLLATCDSLRAEVEQCKGKQWSSNPAEVGHKTLIAMLRKKVATARSDAISECIEKVKALRDQHEEFAKLHGAQGNDFSSNIQWRIVEVLGKVIAELTAMKG